MRILSTGEADVRQVVPLVNTEHHVICWNLVCSTLFNISKSWQRTHFQVKKTDCYFYVIFPGLPVLLAPLETGMHPIKSPSSEPSCNVAVVGCAPPLLRELIFSFLISPSHLAPFLFPILASLLRSISPQGLKACSPWDLGTTHWDSGREGGGGGEGLQKEPWRRKRRCG